MAPTKVCNRQEKKDFLRNRNLIRETEIYYWVLGWHFISLSYHGSSLLGANEEENQIPNACWMWVREREGEMEKKYNKLLENGHEMTMKRRKNEECNNSLPYKCKNHVNISSVYFTPHSLSSALPFWQFFFLS